MERKQRFFIYDKKEAGILIVLATLVALFAFTLGIHLGKGLDTDGKTASHGTGAKLVHTEEDATPNRIENVEQSKGAGRVVNETLDKTLHNEVSHVGVKLETRRQTELPDETASKNAGKTTITEKLTMEEKKVKAARRPKPSGRFTIQVGSHPKLMDAKGQIKELEAVGIQPFLRAVNLKGKGRWYRVYLGGFESKKEAKDSGNRFKKQNVINSFLVSKMP